MQVLVRIVSHSRVLGLLYMFLLKAPNGDYYQIFADEQQKEQFRDLYNKTFLFEFNGLVDWKIVK